MTLIIPFLFFLLFLTSTHIATVHYYVTTHLIIIFRALINPIIDIRWKNLNFLVQVSTELDLWSIICSNLTIRLFDHFFFTYFDIILIINFNLMSLRNFCQSPCFWLFNLYDWMLFEQKVELFVWKMNLLGLFDNFFNIRKHFIIVNLLIFFKKFKYHIDLFHVEFEQAIFYKS